ncbi:MAG: insulinase family protein [Deltaproteobacteria bacterium]|nr:insulinase family protein [Deltaproteobacteria bacterium]
MRLLWLVVGLIAACTSHVDFAGLQTGPRAAVFRDHVETKRLDNGLHLAVLPDTRTNLVAITVRYEVGGADDPADRAGLSHFVEHILAEASERGRERSVLYGNAETWLDRTYFYTVGLDSDVDALVETAVHRFEVGCHDLDPAILARERDVVIEELKLRSRAGWYPQPFLAALWGAGHPYARSVGDASFAAATPQEVCAFIDQHYGPAAATVAIAGNVDPAVVDGITRRFAALPARAIATRAALPQLEPGELRVAVPGLDRPTAALVMRLPGQGSRADPAIEMLDGRTWELSHRIASEWIEVVGEERARILVAFASVDDPTQLSTVATKLREFFATPRFRAFGAFQVQQRRRFVNQFDDLVHASRRITDLIARGQPVDRYRELGEIDATRESDVSHWLAAPAVRVVELVPTSDLVGVHDPAQLATELHHLETPTSGADEPPPAAKLRHGASDVIEDHLANGLTVWLAPDPKAIAVDARVIIPLQPGAGAEYDVASQASEFLTPDDSNLDDADTDRIKWFRSIGSPVTARLGQRSVSFGVSGLALFGDWHVWYLARTLVDGQYNDSTYLHADYITGRGAPDAITVLGRRLDGDRAQDQISMHSRSELEQFRRTHFDPTHATLIITGNFDVTAMRREVHDVFTRWRPLATPPPPPTSEPHAVPGFVAVPVPSALTVEVAVGFAPQPGARVDDPARRVLARILGDRVIAVRESLGISYAIQAAAFRSVVLAGAVDPAFSGDAAQAISTAIATLRDGDDKLAVDFARARNEILREELAEVGTPSGRGRQLERAAVRGEGLAGVDTQIEAIRALTLDDIRHLAAAELAYDRLILVVRGPPDAIKAALQVFHASAFDTVAH